MTDNGSCYRSEAFAKACRDLGLKHVRTKPYTPKTNGKAERFIQTALREWAYAIRLSDIPMPRPRLAQLAASVQLALATCQPKVQNAYQSPRSNRGQPVEAPHLEERPDLRDGVDIGSLATLTPTRLFKHPITN